MSKRLAGAKIRGYDKEDPFKPTFCHWKINEPSQLKKPSVIGCSFMGDLFHKDIDFSDIQEIFNQFWNNPQHTFVLCTKRPERILDLFQSYEDYDDPGLFNNVWFGCSIEDNSEYTQKRLYAMGVLSKDFGLNTWLSIEPLLCDISENIWFNDSLKWIDGVIVGGESGPGARYCNPSWIAKIHHLCVEHTTPFYWKQWGTSKDNLAGPSISHDFFFLEFGDDASKMITMKQIENTKELPWKNDNQ